MHRNSTKWVAERATNNQKNKCMKKLLIFALCLLGICNARAEMMTAQEIVLTEVSHIQPWDSKDEETVLPNIGNDIYVSIDGNDLYVSTDEDMPVYVEVIDQENGDVIAEEEFEGETTMYIPQSGDYELYIYTKSGILLTGDFSVN